MINDKNRFRKHIQHLLKRMSEIYDNIDDQWIVDQIQANKLFLDKTTDIINKIDPHGLICCGAPEDEYQPEAETILLRQSEWETIDALEKVVAEEFAWWFFLYDENEEVKHFGSPEYKVIARQIWNARLETNGKKPIAFKDRIKIPPKRPMIVIEID